MKSLVIRFSDVVSETQTTYERLAAISERLGVSMNKAAHYAINRCYEDVFASTPTDTLLGKSSRKVGQVTYFDAPDDYVRRVEERMAQGVPLPHEDDGTLERFLFFKLLPEADQEHVRMIEDPAEKRALISRLIRERFLSEQTG